MADRVQQRRDPQAVWQAANPVLAEGELGFELDTKLFKMGDGITPWNSLPYRELAYDNARLSNEELVDGQLTKTGVVFDTNTEAYQSGISAYANSEDSSAPLSIVGAGTLNNFPPGFDNTSNYNYYGGNSSYKEMVDYPMVVDAGRIWWLIAGTAGATNGWKLNSVTVEDAAAVSGAVTKWNTLSSFKSSETFLPTGAITNTSRWNNTFVNGYYYFVTVTHVGTNVGYAFSLSKIKLNADGTIKIVQVLNHTHNVAGYISSNLQAAFTIQIVPSTDGSLLGITAMGYHYNPSSQYVHPRMWLVADTQTFDWIEKNGYIGNETPGLSTVGHGIEPAGPDSFHAIWNTSLTGTWTKGQGWGPGVPSPAGIANLSGGGYLACFLARRANGDLIYSSNGNYQYIHWYKAALGTWSTLAINPMSGGNTTGFGLRYHRASDTLTTYYLYNTTTGTKRDYDWTNDTWKAAETITGGVNSITSLITFNGVDRHGDMRYVSSISSGGDFRPYLIGKTGQVAGFIRDQSVNTFWSAADTEAGRFVALELPASSAVGNVQINWHSDLARRPLAFAIDLSDDPVAESATWTNAYNYASGGLPVLAGWNEYAFPVALGVRWIRIRIVEAGAGKPAINEVQWTAPSIYRHGHVNL